MTPMLNSVLLLVIGAGLSFMAAAFWFKRNAAVAEARIIAVEHTKTLARLTEVESKLALVNQAVIPISTAFQAILIKELTHYHTPEADALLVKVGPPNTLTPDEEARLAILLDERTRDMGELISESERDAALILPAIMKRARAEADTLDSAESLKVKLVTVAAVLGISNVEHDQPDAAKSLQQIEENTAATAEALATLNTRATKKLASTAVDKSKVERGRDDNDA